jgi:DNA-binding NtrC family response regulator
LRERRDDIPLLADHFLSAAARELNKKSPTLPKELFDLLKLYPFPGNVRELQAIIFDAVSRHKSGVLSLEVFRAHIAKHQRREKGLVPDLVAPEEAGSRTVSFGENLPTIKQATDLLVAEALKRSGGNQSIAAGLLGISQQALSKRLQKKNQP